MLKQRFRCQPTIQLETALCYQHYFCNTELRTTIITEIKGLSIRTQQNTFVLFTLFKLTLDEHKTLTKIPTCKTSHNDSPKQAQASNDKRSKETSKQGKEQSSIKRRKGRLHVLEIFFQTFAKVVLVFNNYFL